jgi:membrane associated rhomboid family serine protease
MSDFRYYKPNNFPPIVKNLIIINILVWVAQQMFDPKYHITEKIALYPIMPQALKDIVLHSPGLEDYYGFHPFQIATHMFAHGPIYHILFNMFALWMFGKILENVWGAKRFLLFYLACGIGAAACHLIIQYFRCVELLHVVQANPADPRISGLLGALSTAVGASGAIMGVLVAFAYLFPNTELYIMFIPVPVKAKWAVMAMAAIDIFGGVANFSGDNIAHFAHLGGAITGFILVLIWNRTNRRTFY